MTNEEAELNAQARRMACTKLVENNPDEFERYYIKFLNDLRKGDKNGRKNRDDR
jgi:hypothetical protein